MVVGETLRRLLSRMTIVPHNKKIDAYLGHLQVGVGIAGGAEAMIHVLRQWKQRKMADMKKVLVLTDLSNAFRNLDRSAFREVVRRVMPDASAWVDLCYDEDSVLRLGRNGTWLDSARGIQQGNPLGPALFAIAIQDHIVAARTETTQRYVNIPK